MASFFLFLLIICGNAEYEIKSWNTTIINPTNNHEIPLTIHYPLGTLQTYPVMVFYHGWECQNTWYNFIWQTLVPNGYIVAMPNDYTQSNTTNENDCAISQRYTLEWLIHSCNVTESCPLYQMIGSKSIAIGHSMGGGTTFLSASSNYTLEQTFSSSFDAAFGLSGCGDTSDIIQAMQYMDVPIFLFSASHDCMCPFKTTASVYYQALPGHTCRFIADIADGGHCGFMDAPSIHQNACNVFDDASCPFGDHDNIALNKQIDIVLKYLVYFADATMKDSNNENDFKRIANTLQEDKDNGLMDFVNSVC